MTAIITAARGNVETNHVSSELYQKLPAPVTCRFRLILWKPAATLLNPLVLGLYRYKPVNRRTDLDPRFRVKESAILAVSLFFHFRHNNPLYRNTNPSITRTTTATPTHNPV